MRIISTPLPAAPSELASNRPTIVMALDTLVDQKGVVVGLIEGATDGPDVADIRCSPVGRAVLDRCAAHMDLNYPQGAVVLAGVAQVASAKQRVRDVLTKAPPHSLVVLLCANGKTYDAAFDALCIDFQAANAKPQ